MHAFQALERCKRLIDAAQIALAHRDEIEHVAVLGNFREQRLSATQRGGELAALEEGADAEDLGLDARSRSMGSAWLHVRSRLAPVPGGRLFCRGIVHEATAWP